MQNYSRQLYVEGSAYVPGQGMAYMDPMFMGYRTPRGQTSEDVVQWTPYDGHAAYQQQQQQQTPQPAPQAPAPVQQPAPATPPQQFDLGSWVNSLRQNVGNGNLGGWLSQMRSGGGSNRQSAFNPNGWQQTYGDFLSRFGGRG